MTKTAPTPAQLSPASRRQAALARQHPRREAECNVRSRAVELSQRLKQAGYSGAQAARRLRVNPRTLNHWTHLSSTHNLRAHSRGRPCHESSSPIRQEVVWTIQREGLHLGMPTLRSLLPCVRRCELFDLRDQCRDFHRQHAKATLYRLRWRQPGTVWAVDHAAPPARVEGTMESVLAVRDLASGFQLAWLPVRDATAQTAIDALEPLIDRYGAPFVLKSDNGSAFKSTLFANMLAEHQIIHLKSPPCTPWYNGACEASIGAMRIRTQHFAERAGRFQQWARADFEAALHQANEVHRSESDPYRSAKQRWGERRNLASNERKQFSNLISQQRLALWNQTAHDDSKCTGQSLERKAVTQALVDLGLLTLSRRSIHLPINKPRLARFS